MATSILIINLSSEISPEKAVANLSGLKFKRAEQRMKRYTMNGNIAEAYLDGPLKVYTLKPKASLDNATLFSRRWLTIADFPWSSHMDTETILLQHTIFVTHRVSVICETGLGPEHNSVRIEWDFAAGKRVQQSKVDDDHCERVDYILKTLGISKCPAAKLILGRLKRERAAIQGLKQNTQIHSKEGDDEGAEEVQDDQRQ